MPIVSPPDPTTVDPTQVVDLATYAERHCVGGKKGISTVYDALQRGDIPVVVHNRKYYTHPTWVMEKAAQNVSGIAANPSTAGRMAKRPPSSTAKRRRQWADAELKNRGF